MGQEKRKRPATRLTRTWQALFLLGGLAAAMAGWNVYSLRRDIGLALGSQGPAQERFFVEAAERPDINEFYKNLTPEQRRAMARNIGRYQDAQLAKLIGKLLQDFDAPARAELAKSLAVVAKGHPDAVATELKNTSAFQLLGVTEALRSLGPDAIPVVAKQLSNADQRRNAGSFMVGIGEPAVPALLQALKDENKDTRAAAADALGKIRSRTATSALLALAESSPTADRLPYLSALASIGDPASEPMLRRAFDDLALPTPLRVQAALGLGRIASPTALDLLWRAESNPGELGDSVRDALVLASDRALAVNVPLARKLPIAAGLRTPGAEAVLRAALADPDLREDASDASANRPAMVGALTTLVASLDPAVNGRAIDRALTALATTEEGGRELDRLAQRPELAGLIARRESLQ